MKMTLHGAAWASSHTSKVRPVPSGNRNSASAAIAAMLPSLHAPGGSSGATSGRVTQPAKVSANSAASAGRTRTWRRRAVSAGRGTLAGIGAVLEGDARSVIETRHQHPLAAIQGLCGRGAEAAGLDLPAALGSAERADARIVNIASIASHTVLPGLSAYNASKASVAMLTRSLAREWSRKGIAVNALCPGYIETDINGFWWGTEGGQKQLKLFPRRRLMEASDLDAAFMMLCGPAARAIAGSVITIDDGQTLPGGG